MGKIRDSVDARALRFAVGFPLMLAVAFVVCALLIRVDLPEPLAVGDENRQVAARVRWNLDRQRPEEIDGAVAKVDQLSQRELLGFTSRAPR